MLDSTKKVLTHYPEYKIGTEPRPNISSATPGPKYNVAESLKNTSGSPHKPSATIGNYNPPNVLIRSTPVEGPLHAAIDSNKILP